MVLTEVHQCILSQFLYVGMVCLLLQSTTLMCLMPKFMINCSV